MFGSLKDLISSLVEDARLKKFEDTDCRLATAALLIRVATVNSEMSETRRQNLHAVLKSRFGLDDLTTVQLIHDAAAADLDLYHFTRQLSDVLDNEGRQRTVKMMSQVIYADERVSEFESNIIWRTDDLLGVSSRQRIELRQRVAVRQGRAKSSLIFGEQSKPWLMSALPPKADICSAQGNVR